MKHYPPSHGQVKPEQTHKAGTHTRWHPTEMRSCAQPPPGLGLCCWLTQGAMWGRNSHSTKAWGNSCSTQKGKVLPWITGLWLGLWKLTLGGATSAFLPSSSFGLLSSQGCRAGPAPQQCRLTGCTLRVWPQPSEVEQFHHPNEGWTGPLLSDNIWTLQSRLLTMINRDCHSTCKAIDDRLSFLKHVFMLENF